MRSVTVSCHLRTSQVRASCRKIPVTTGPTAGETTKDGSGQHVVVIRLIKSALTVAREQYNWVQLCILSVSPHKLCNLQQADQPRTPDIAHAQYQCMPNGRRLYMTSVIMRAGMSDGVCRFWPQLSYSEKKSSLFDCRKKKFKLICKKKKKRNKKDYIHYLVIIKSLHPLVKSWVQMKYFQDELSAQH